MPQVVSNSLEHTFSICYYKEISHLMKISISNPFVDTQEIIAVLSLN